MELRWPQEDDDRDDEDGDAKIAVLTEGEETEFDVISLRLESHLFSLGGRFALISDQDVREITTILLERRDRQMNVENNSALQRNR
ncbi:hypothetical protein CWR43_14145 [Rhizobium sullae]|uniref:Uncharacterized protein n=1 Tax=Rhizobium sullae TaxID=50338 RepID=A0A2N0DAN9_RHISU|nr:hypothetical protein CWR43_14145 [Rhizobium sullae]